VRPDKNEARFYRMEVPLDLFGRAPLLGAKENVCIGRGLRPWLASPVDITILQQTWKTKKSAGTGPTGLERTLIQSNRDPPPLPFPRIQTTVPTLQSLAKYGAAEPDLKQYEPSLEG
jgi:hypothetical protein